MSRRQVAWILILIVDLGFIAWGAGAAAAPDLLPGPGGRGILPAAYEGYSGGSWPELLGAFPLVAGYMKVLYRMYGIYCALFGLLGSAIRSSRSAAASAGHGGRCSSATRWRWFRRSRWTRW